MPLKVPNMSLHTSGETGPATYHPRGHTIPGEIGPVRFHPTGHMIPGEIGPVRLHPETP